jgi:hypothetical protein
MVLTDDGMQIDCSCEQFANANSPRIKSLEPDSNVKVESSVQSRKHSFDIISTEEGMQMA